jgi:peptide/nickel transport system permease protein
MSEETAAPAPAALPARPPLALPRGKARLGLIATLVLLLVGFVSLVFTPWPTDTADIGMALLDPSLAHPFGTDAQGRDVLSLIMKGMLTSYVVAAIGVAIGLFVGVPLGILAATFDSAATRLARWMGDPVGVIPALAVAIVLAVLAGPGPVVAMVAIGFAAIPIAARTTWRVAAAPHRAEPMAASRLAGMTRWDALVRHALPEIPAALFGRSLSLLGFAVLAEAALSYAGLGAQPAGLSLGLMLRDAQSAMLFEPVLVLAPGFTVTLVAVALQLAGRGFTETPDLRLNDQGLDDALA